MSKLTVKEYANKYQITRQTVYNQVKKGLLESIEEDGVTLIIDEALEVSNSSQNDDCQKLVKILMKRITKLEKKLDKERDKNSSLILTYVEEMKTLYLPNKEQKTKNKKTKKKKNKS